MSDQEQKPNKLMQILNSVSTAAKVVISIATVISSIVAWTVYIDTRYAHASDVEKQQQVVVRELRSNFLMLRLEVTEDRIRDMKLKREKYGLDPDEKVRLEELEKRRNTLNLQLNAIK